MKSLELKESEMIVLAVSALCGNELKASNEKWCLICLTSTKQEHKWMPSTMKGLIAKKLEGLAPHFSERDNSGIVPNCFWLSKALHNKAYSLYKNDEAIREKVNKLTK
jgi:hypothetical protein